MKIFREGKTTKSQEIIKAFKSVKKCKIWEEGIQMNKDLLMYGLRLNTLTEKSGSEIYLLSKSRCRKLQPCLNRNTPNRERRTVNKSMKD